MIAETPTMLPLVHFAPLVVGGQGAGVPGLKSAISDTSATAAVLAGSPAMLPLVHFAPLVVGGQGAGVPGLKNATLPLMHFAPLVVGGHGAGVPGLKYAPLAAGFAFCPSEAVSEPAKAEVQAASTKTVNMMRRKLTFFTRISLAIQKPIGIVPRKLQAG